MRCLAGTHIALWPIAGPFDRVMLAQAICEDVVFVTHDAAFKRYEDDHVLLV